MIKKKIAVSITIWPSETLSPAVQLPFSEALMVATRVGPGASAPVNPMRRPRTSVERISASNSVAPLLYLWFVVPGDESADLPDYYVRTEHRLSRNIILHILPYPEYSCTGRGGRRIITLPYPETAH